jgi:PilZ domain-containing protein
MFAGWHEIKVTVLPAAGIVSSIGLKYPKRQDLVLGQNSLIFALKFRLSGVSLATNPGTAGVLMSDGAERREARRFNMSLPLRVTSPGAKGRELDTYTRDLSYRGLYFLAEADFEVGSEIDFVITLPQQVTQSGDVNIRCQGNIVRVEAADNGRVGIAAKIARYEFLPAAATAA